MLNAGNTMVILLLIDSELFQLPWLFDEELHIEDQLLKKQQKLAQAQNAWSNNLNPLPQGESGHADVVCVEESEVYSWTFQALHELMSGNSMSTLYLAYIQTQVFLKC